ncbi:MAG TPA: phosphomethylpyrimidine synthase ThiC, partial [Verrucomicrobiae bacterium]
MIATKESFEPHSTEQLPASKRVYIQGQLHKDIRVPMREIELTPTKSFNGELEPNAPVRVYDCSGPWGDTTFKGTSDEGLPALRRDWILKRGDVEEHDGREVKPQDDGYLSGKHAEYASKAEKNRLIEFPGLTSNRRRPLRAKAGKVVTQLAYARAGVITPEMEFIAIRENMGRARISDMANDIVRNQLDKQHAGSQQLASSEFTPSIFRRFPQRIPKEITPEFVRDEVAAGRAIIPNNIN